MRATFSRSCFRTAALPALVVLLLAAGLSPLQARAPQAAEPTLRGWKVSELPGLGGVGTAYALTNNFGYDVVGASRTADGSGRAVLWHLGTAQDLGTLGGPTSIAYGVAEAGSGVQVVGYSEVLPSGSSAFSFQGGRMTALEGLGGQQAVAYGVLAGRVVGFATRADAARRPVVWEDGRLRDLGTLSPGARSTALVRPTT